MNKEEIDKWLDNEYGVSYTSLEEIHDWLVDENIKKDKEIERLNDRIGKAIKLLEEYLDREYVITDEYFEHIIQILKDDYEYVFVGSDKE